MPVNPCRCIVIRLRSWNHQGQTGFDGLLALRRCPSGSDRRGGERSRQRYDGHPLHRSPAVPARFGRPLPGCVSGRIDEARPILSGATTAPCYGPAFTASILHDAGATDLEASAMLRHRDTRTTEKYYARAISEKALDPGHAKLRLKPELALAARVEELWRI